MKKKTVPTFDEVMNPTLQALKRLGGSASIDELVPEIVRLLELPQELADVPHGTTGRTELEYRSAWARTYLRKAGLIENSERGIWALTPLGSQTESVDGRQIAREIAKQFQTERPDAGESGEPSSTDATEPPITWQDKLLAVVQAMDPIALNACASVFSANLDSSKWRLLRAPETVESTVTARFALAV